MPKRKDHMKNTFRKIKLLSVATPRARKQLIADGDRKVIDCVFECSANILKDNVPLSDWQKAKLCKHKNNLRKLELEKVSLKKKKHIIQTEGFSIGAILAPDESVLASLLFRWHGPCIENFSSRLTLWLMQQYSSSFGPRSSNHFGCECRFSWKRKTITIRTGFTSLSNKFDKYRFGGE